MKYTCPKCKGDKVFAQYIKWINANTGEQEGAPYLKDYWCDNCQKRIKPIIVKEHGKEE